MEGRKSKALVVRVADVDPARASEVDAWFAGNRAPEVLRSPSFIGGARYRGTHLPGGGLKRPQYLTVFETNAEDPVAAWDALELGEDHPAVHQLAFSVYEETGNLEVPALDGPKRSVGLLVGVTDCIAVDRLEDFHRWYDEVHAADVVGSPFYHSGFRGERVSGDLGRFIALYETQHKEPGNFKAYFDWPERDREMSDTVAVRHVWTFNRIFTSDSLDPTLGASPRTPLPPYPDQARETLPSEPPGPRETLPSEPPVGVEPDTSPERPIRVATIPPDPAVPREVIRPAPPEPEPEPS